MKSTLWLAVVLWASVAAAVVTTLDSEQDSAVDLAVSDGVDFFPTPKASLEEIRTGVAGKVAGFGGSKLGEPAWDKVTRRASSRKLQSNLHRWLTHSLTCD